MIEITIWADIHSTGIINSIGKYYLREETTISKDTWFKLQKWVNDYDDVAIMDSDERRKNLELISSLDTRGIELVQKISNEWKFDKSTGSALKFIYYSEGLLKRLNFIEPIKLLEEE